MNEKAAELMSNKYKLIKNLSKIDKKLRNYFRLVYEKKGVIM